jgi:transcriptional regulator with XRE-family HTH domain
MLRSIKPQAKQPAVGFTEIGWRTSPGSVSGLEQGRRNPTVVSLCELATALGVSHIELV